MRRSQARRKPEAMELGGEGADAFKSPGLCCILNEAERRESKRCPPAVSLTGASAGFS